MYIVVLLVAVAISLGIAMINGAQNIGKIIGVSTRRVKRRSRLVYTANAVFMGIGAFTLGSRISKTIAKGIIDFSLLPGETSQLLASSSIVFSTIIVASISLHYKIPLSISQLVVGSAIGTGLALCGLECLNTERIALIVSSWITTPLIAGLTSTVLYKLDEYVSSRGNPRIEVALYTFYFSFSMFIVQYLLLSEFTGPEISFVYALFFAINIALALIIYSYTLEYPWEEELDILKFYTQSIIVLLLGLSYGAHDIGNAAGPLSLIFSYMYPSIDHLHTAITLTSLAFFVGAAIWGYRIAGTIGGGITPLTPTTGFIVQVSTAFTLFLVVSMGIPSSITLTLLGSIAGVGYARGLNYVNTKMLIKINLFWIVGVASTIVASYLFTMLFKIIL